MSRFNCIRLYLSLSALNGFVPFTITFLFTKSFFYATFVWVGATGAAFLLISLVCMRGTTHITGLQVEDKAISTKLVSLQFIIDQSPAFSIEGVQHIHRDTSGAAAQQFDT